MASVAPVESPSSTSPPGAPAPGGPEPALNALSGASHDDDSPTLVEDSVKKESQPTPASSAATLAEAAAAEDEHDLPAGGVDTPPSPPAPGGGPKPTIDPPSDGRHDDDSVPHASLVEDSVEEEEPTPASPSAATHAEAEAAAAKDPMLAPQLTATPGVLELPAVGARVRCEGLIGAGAELNGCLGRVVGHEEGERARVLMDGGRGVGMEPRNLVVVFELLDRMLAVPHMFAREVLARLDPADRALVRQAGGALRTATRTQIGARLTFFLYTSIQPQGASHGELNQPTPQFRARLTFCSTFRENAQVHARTRIVVADR